MKIELEYAHSCRWQTQDFQSILCIAKFKHLVKELPFSASLLDIEPHGREIWLRCVRGDFGPIAEYDPIASNPKLELTPVPPTALEAGLPMEVVFGDSKDFTDSVNSEANDRSSRGLVVVLGGYLDDLLQKALDECKRRNGIAISTRGTFGQRIARAKVHGIISDRSASRLESIRAVRNEMSHNWKIANIETVLDPLRALYDMDSSKTYVFQQDDVFLFRTVFFWSCCLAMFRLQMYLSGVKDVLDDS